MSNSNYSNERALREEICRVGRLMHDKNFIDGTSGNISVRLEDERILATPSGLAKGFMQPEQLIVINLEGERVDAPTDANQDLKPTSESAMHLECYRQRPDVMSVIHAHPPTAVALTIAGYNFQQCLIPEMVVILGLIPTAPYSTPSSNENRDAISQLVLEHDVIMLAHHGSLTVANSLWDAYLKLETLEHSANILYKVEQLGGAKSTITPDNIEKLLGYREKFGLMRQGDRERFEHLLQN